MRRTNEMEYADSVEADWLTQYIVSHNVLIPLVAKVKRKPFNYDKIIAEFFTVIADTVYFMMNNRCDETGTQFTTSDIYTTAWNVLCTYYDELKGEWVR